MLNKHVEPFADSTSDTQIAPASRPAWVQPAVTLLEVESGTLTMDGGEAEDCCSHT